MSCILAATDFSPGAERAVQRAATLAAERGAPLWLVHVYNAGGWGSVAAAVGSPAAAPAELRPALVRALDELADALRAQYGIAVDTRFAEGPASREIAALAAAAQAALVVVGEHGENWVRDLVLGGTALKVLGRTKSPVLMVRGDARADYTQIVAATDFSAGALRAVLAAHALQPRAGLHLVHAFGVPFEGRMRMAGVTDAQIAAFRDGARDGAQARMNEFVAGLPEAARGRVLTRQVVRGYPAAAILDAAEATAAELIAIGRHGGSSLDERLFGSVTQNVLYRARCDVLVVPWATSRPRPAAPPTARRRATPGRIEGCTPTAACRICAKRCSSSRSPACWCR